MRVADRPAGVTVKRAVMVIVAAFLLSTVLVFGSAEVDASPSDWDGVAECESGNTWDINTGNGFYGGLQFTIGTWNWAAGSSAHTAHLVGVRPDHATRGEQIAVADNLRTIPGGGLGHWPVCGSRYGTPLPVQGKFFEQGWFGRVGDIRYECQISIPDMVTVVVRRGNEYHLDLDHRGGKAERIIGWATAADEFDCYDVDGDGTDDMVAIRGDQRFWSPDWITTVGFRME